MSLPAADRALLKKLLELGHRLESLWPRSSDPTSHGEVPTEDLKEFQNLLSTLKNAENADLKRLLIHERDLRPEMTARHLATILVPFERLAGRTLRDDEIQIDENDLTTGQRQSVPLVVMADNLRSAFNVGAIVRTAEAMGLEKVLLTGYTPFPDELKTRNTSMGAEKHIPWQHIERAETAIEQLKSDGYAVICLETARSATPLNEFRWPEKSALLLGNERFGLDHPLLAKADHIVRIPQYGVKNSLNVAIAFGIAAADYRKKISSQAHTMTPIGYFHASPQFPYEARRQGVIDQSNETGIIELNEGCDFEQALEDLEGFERIWVLYNFHHNANWKPKVLPPRGPLQKRGVFATRSPYRPNAIGLSSVELIQIEGRKIEVCGFDLLDGSQIYDLKPYLPYADAFPNAKAGWTDGLEELAYVVSISAQAADELDWLETRKLTQLRGFLFSSLEFDPLDDRRKRLTVSKSVNGPHVLKYRTWRAEFTIDSDKRRVAIQKISSGYSSEDLNFQNGAYTDKYHDKDLHRDFNARAIVFPKT